MPLQEVQHHAAAAATAGLPDQDIADTTDVQSSTQLVFPEDVFLDPEDDCAQSDWEARADFARQPTSSLPDLAEEDCDQSEWEARANFVRSLSSNPRDSYLDLGKGSAAQSEWEARALWSLESRRASGEQPLEIAFSKLPGVSQLPLAPCCASAATDSAAVINGSHELLQDNELRNEHVWSAQCETGLQQPLSAKSALQRALSNIQFIATGSQTSRAAAAAAAAAAAQAQATEHSSAIYAYQARANNAVQESTAVNTAQSESNELQHISSGVSPHLNAAGQAITSQVGAASARNHMSEGNDKYQGSGTKEEFGSTSAVTADRHEFFDSSVLHVTSAAAVDSMARVHTASVTAPCTVAAPSMLSPQSLDTMSEHVDVTQQLDSMSVPQRDMAGIELKLHQALELQTQSSGLQLHSMAKSQPDMMVHGSSASQTVTLQDNGSQLWPMSGSQSLLLLQPVGQAAKVQPASVDPHPGSALEQQQQNDISPTMQLQQQQIGYQLCAIQQPGQGKLDSQHNAQTMMLQQDPLQRLHAANQQSALELEQAPCRDSLGVSQLADLHGSLVPAAMLGTTDAALCGQASATLTTGQPMSEQLANASNAAFSAQVRSNRKYSSDLHQCFPSCVASSCSTNCPCLCPYSSPCFACVCFPCIWQYPCLCQGVCPYKSVLALLQRPVSQMSEQALRAPFYNMCITLCWLLCRVIQLSRGG